MITKEPKKVVLIDSSTKDVSESETAEMARLRRENELLQEKIKSLADPWAYRAVGLQACKENRVLQALGWFEKALVNNSSVISDDDMKRLPDSIDLTDALMSRVITDVDKIPEIQKRYSEFNIDVVIQGDVCFIKGENSMRDEIRELSALSDQRQFLCRGMQSILTVCAFLGYEKLLRHLVDRRADVNRIGDEGQTLLITAGKVGHIGILKYLVEEKKMDLHQLDRFGRNVLFYAAQGGHLLMVKYLIDEKKMDISQWIKSEDADLLYAARTGRFPKVKYFVEEKGINISQRNESDETLLFAAVDSGSIPMVKYLVEERGIDIHQLNFRKRTILFYAVKRGLLQMVKYFVEQQKMNIFITDQFGKNLLCCCSDPSIIKYLLDRGLRLTPKQRRRISKFKLALYENEEKAYNDKVSEQQHRGTSDTYEKSEDAIIEAPTVRSVKSESEQEMGSERNNRPLL